MGERGALAKQPEKEKQTDLSQDKQTIATENSVQAMFLDLFQRVRFNLLDGQAVVRDLLQPSGKRSILLDFLSRTAIAMTILVNTFILSWI